MSNKTISKDQFLKKDSTHIDIKPGSNFQEILKDCIHTFSEKFLKPVIERITNGVCLGNFFKPKKIPKKNVIFVNQVLSLKQI